MRMTLITGLGAGVLALALSACNAADDQKDPYLASIPDPQALTLEIQGGTAEGSALSVDLPPTPAVAIAGTPVTEDDLAVGRARIRALNEAVRQVFERVSEVASTGGQELPGGVKQYGPSDRCVQVEADGACGATANLRLRIKRVSDRLGTFLLEARAEGAASDGDFRPVLAGYLDRGMMERRGTGRLAVNLENLKSAAGGTYRGQGYLVTGFAAGPVAKAATFRMLSFSRDVAARAPITATFVGFKNGAGIARVRVAALGDYDKAGPAEELGILRLVHSPSLGGRAFSIVTNRPDGLGGFIGDVATTSGGVQQYWFGRACYAAGQTTPEYKEWFLCPKTVDGVPSGPAACVESGVVPTTVIGTGSWQTSSCYSLLEVEEMRPPEAPGASPDDDSPERGMGSTGITPATCPPDPRNANVDPPMT